MRIRKFLASIHMNTMINELIMITRHLVVSNYYLHYVYFMIFFNGVKTIENLSINIVIKENSALLTWVVSCSNIGKLLLIC